MRESQPSQPNNDVYHSGVAKILRLAILNERQVTLLARSEVDPESKSKQGLPPMGHCPDFDQPGGY